MLSWKGGEMGMLKLLYKDKEYTWEEWRDDYNIFNESLELPNEFLDLSYYRGFIAGHDFGYEIAINKILELYNLLASARFALTLSYQKYYDANILSFSNDYRAHLWLRTEYLKNSIIWYNSCEDYVYQILWFAFALHKKNIFSREDYLSLLKKCRYEQIISILKDIDTDNAKELIKMINDYREKDDIKYLREELANNLKHRANISFKGLYESSGILFEDLSNGSELIQSTNFVKPLIVDIDETIDCMKRTHVIIIDYARAIVKFLNIEEVFEKDDKGINNLCLIREKSKYKKITF